MARALDIMRAATVQDVGPAQGPADALRRHWPEYLMEAAGLGLFMISAGLFGTLLFHPQSSALAALPDPLARRALMGAFMGLTVILVTTNTARLMPLTGVFAGCLVALYITFEAPLSGMSMNPARSLASALPGGLFEALWIYFAGPAAGMLLAVEAYRLIRRTPEVICAKLNHCTHRRCIFRCSYANAEPPAASHS